MAWVQFAQQNTVKTANQNSRINFYFVTCFYSKYDICMADMKYIFFDKKTKQRLLQDKSVKTWII